MSKISTKAIKALIPIWLSAYGEKRFISDYGDRFGDPDEAWDQFIDSNSWRRESKKKIGNELDSYFKDGRFIFKLIGECKNQIIDELNKDAALKKCIVRTFAQEERIDIDFHGYFSLIVIPNPEDTEIIGWTLA